MMIPKAFYNQGLFGNNEGEGQLSMDRDAGKPRTFKKNDRRCSEDFRVPGSDRRPRHWRIDKKHQQSVSWWLPGS